MNSIRSNSTPVFAHTRAKIKDSSDRTRTKKNRNIEISTLQTISFFRVGRNYLHFCGLRPGPAFLDAIEIFCGGGGGGYFQTRLV
jgi:hypothetical protein